MRATILAHSGPATDPPELYLLLAVIRRAHLDIAYMPKSGVKHRTITPEDQNSAHSFLRYLQRACDRDEAPP